MPVIWESEPLQEMRCEECAPAEKSPKKDGAASAPQTKSWFDGVAGSGEHPAILAASQYSAKDDGKYDAVYKRDLELQRFQSSLLADPKFKAAFRSLTGSQKQNIVDEMQTEMEKWEYDVLSDEQHPAKLAMKQKIMDQIQQLAKRKHEGDSTLSDADDDDDDITSDEDEDDVLSDEDEGEMQFQEAFDSLTDSEKQNIMDQIQQYTT